MRINSGIQKDRGQILGIIRYFVWADLSQYENTSIPCFDCIAGGVYIVERKRKEIKVSV